MSALPMKQEQGILDTGPLVSFSLPDQRIMCGGVIQIGLHVEDMLPDLRALMLRYRNRLMSLADACMVRLSELHPKSEVFTLDSDFRIYRRHSNK